MEFEKQITFNYHQEGRLFFKSSHFSLKILELGLKENVGVTRDVLIPFYSIFREEFAFLNEDEDHRVIEKFRGVGNGAEEIIHLRGEYKSDTNSKKIEIGKNQVDLRLLSHFDKYKDGKIFHKIHWVSGGDLDQQDNTEPSVDEFLVGVGFYISSFRFSFDEFSKVGLAYRVLNIPSKTTSFEFKLHKDLEIYFNIGRGVSPQFCGFIERIFLCLVEVFSLEQEISDKFSEIIEKVSLKIK